MTNGHAMHAQRRTLIVTSWALSALAATLLAAVIYPEATERIYGEARTALLRSQLTLSEDLPEITIGVTGTAADIDRCDGTFTEMITYRVAGVPPTAAAHNNCGGDIMLPWDIGQQFRADGAIYEVTEIREVPKVGSTTDDLIGLRGDLGLQTCYYGQNLMKIVGATKVPAEHAP